MKSLEIKARSKVKRMLAAEAEGKSLEDERRRQLAALFEAEDVGDERVVRKQKELIRSIDERLSTTAAKVIHYKTKSLKACQRAVDAEISAWQTGGRAEHQRRIFAGEAEAGQLLGRAVAILTQIGPAHHPFISNLSRLFEPLGPNHLPIAGSRVVAAFKNTSKEPVHEIIDRSYAGVMDRAGGDSIARQNTITKLFGSLLREETAKGSKF